MCFTEQSIHDIQLRLVSPLSARLAKLHKQIREVINYLRVACAFLPQNGILIDIFCTYASACLSMLGAFWYGAQSSSHLHILRRFSEYSDTSPILPAKLGLFWYPPPFWKPAVIITHLCSLVNICVHNFSKTPLHLLCNRRLNLCWMQLLLAKLSKNSGSKKECPKNLLAALQELAEPI